MPMFLRGAIPGQRCGFPMDPEGASTFECIAVISHL
jgi:hypothetical protein